MAEITDSFCERCGTHYTFDAPRPKKRLGSARLLAKAAKNFVMSDSTSVSDAMELARHDEEREVSNAVVSQFHSTFNFCMSCRQYTCEKCWNEREGACLSCAPAGPEDTIRPGAIETLAAAAPPQKPSVLEWPAVDLDRSEAAAAGNGHESPDERVPAAAEPPVAAEARPEPLEAPALEPVPAAPAEVTAVSEAPEPVEAAAPELAAAVRDIDLELTAEELQLAEKQLAESQPASEPVEATAVAEAAAVEPETVEPETVDAEAVDAEDLIAEIEEIQRALAAKALPAPEYVGSDESPEAILTAEELAEIEARLESPTVATTAEMPQAEPPVPAVAPERPRGLLARFIHHAAPEPAAEAPAQMPVEAPVESVADEVVEPPARVWPQPTSWTDSPIRHAIIDWDALESPAAMASPEPIEVAAIEAEEPEPVAVEAEAAPAIEVEPVTAEAEAAPAIEVEPVAVEPEVVEVAAVAAVEPEVVESVAAEVVEPVAVEPEVVESEAVEAAAAEPEPAAAGVVEPVEAEAVKAVAPGAAPEPVVAPTPIAPTLPSPPPAWPRPQVPPPWGAPQTPMPHAALPPQWRRSPVPAADAWDDSARQLLARPSGARACKQCALPISTNARFCRRCGTRQDADEPIGAGVR